MTEDAETVHEYFTKLGLPPEVADLYEALRSHGPQSILKLSRNARVERTRIYRLLDALKDHHLIEEETHDKRKIYKAAPLTNLQIVLSKREQQLLDLRLEMQQLQEKLGADSPMGAHTHVQFYQGADGIRQMMWNETKSTSENLSLLYENMQSRTNLAFFQRWVEKCNANDIKFRGIINDNFIATQQSWYKDHANERIRNWQARHISDDIFTIEHSTVIYDNVVAYYDWKGNDVFGMEIHNAHIAQGQRQLFELLWKLSKPVDDLTGITL